MTAGQPSPKRRKHVKERGETTGDEPAVQEDTFIQKIHARPIDEKYVLDHKLGEGGFGMVFLGIYDPLNPLHRKCTN